MIIRHQSVMPREVIRHLITPEGRVYVDGTVGEGGHASLILNNTDAQIRLIGIDRDASAIASARVRLKEFQERVLFVNDSYADVGNILEQLAVKSVSGILLDLGFSSFQIDDPKRGFSFSSDERLDMRFDTSQSQTAYDLINELSKDELKKIFFQYGEERRAGAIAGAIVRNRSKAKIETTRELADIAAAVGIKKSRTGIHPATRIFQALRIAVNRELEHLERFLKSFVSRLESRGRIVIISYHSLEDRLVKKCFQGLCSFLSLSQGFPSMRLWRQTVPQGTYSATAHSH